VEFENLFNLVFDDNTVKSGARLRSELKGFIEVLNA
jgi:hypothetical protein